jgi:FMN-dependent NADH-azoreductase
MTTLLQIKSSLFGDQGQSSQLADAFVTSWRARNPDGRVIIRNLAHDPVPHLDAARFLSFLARPETRDAEQQAAVACSDALIEELKAAELIVIGVPMYNFGIPSTLKAYFDHVARAGITFSYTEDGPVGLLTGKKALVTAARGGRYLGTPFDTQTDYVRHFLGFIGIDDVEFVYAEGLNLGEENKAAGLADAHLKLAELAA